MIAAGLVDVRRTQDVETLDAGGKRNGTANNSAGALCGVDDFESRLIDQLVIKRLEANADALRLHLSDFPKKKNNKRTKGAQYNHAPFPLSRVTEKNFIFFQYVRTIFGNYSMILATTPAPTVWPPSRIAKRRPSCMAIGQIS